MTIAKTLSQLTDEHVRAMTHWRVFASEAQLDVFCRGFAPSSRTGLPVERWFEFRHNKALEFEPLLRQWHVRISPPHQESRIRVDTPRDAAALRTIFALVRAGLEHVTDADLRAQGARDVTVADLRSRVQVMADFLR